MPTRDTPWPNGTPCWADLSVPDVPKAVEFYSAVLGWSLVDSGEEFGHYHIAQVNGQAAAGVGPVMAEGQPSYWTLYIASDDADGTAKLITDNGGSVIMPPMDIPGTGRMCIASDTMGAVFGVWQSLGMIGAGIYNEPGGIVWEDARLSDVEAGRTFYTEVFGWSYGEIPGLDMPEYGTFSGGGDPLGGLGGLMGAPEGTPSHWLVYFGSTDADAAIATLERLGGSVLRPAEDTPYGRMAVVTDPFGAPFAIHQAPAG
jgi:uncharacterized protein